MIYIVEGSLLEQLELHKNFKTDGQTKIPHTKNQRNYKKSKKLKYYIQVIQKAQMKQNSG